MAASTRQIQLCDVYLPESIDPVDVGRDLRCGNCPARGQCIGSPFAVRLFDVCHDIRRSRLELECLGASLLKAKRLFSNQLRPADDSGFPGLPAPVRETGLIKVWFTFFLAR